MFLPSLTSLVRCGGTLLNSIGGIQDAVAALAVDWTFAVVRNPQPVRVHVGSLVRDEAHPILVYKMVSNLCPIGQVVNVFHSIDQIVERLPSDSSDLT